MYTRPCGVHTSPCGVYTRPCDVYSSPYVYIKTSVLYIQTPIFYIQTSDHYTTLSTTHLNLTHTQYFSMVFHLYGTIFCCVSLVFVSVLTRLHLWIDRYMNTVPLVKLIHLCACVCCVLFFFVDARHHSRVNIVVSVLSTDHINVL